METGSGGTRRLHIPGRFFQPALSSRRPSTGACSAADDPLDLGPGQTKFPGDRRRRQPSFEGRTDQPFLSRRNRGYLLVRCAALRRFRAFLAFTPALRSCAVRGVPAAPARFGGNGLEQPVQLGVVEIPQCAVEVSVQEQRDLGILRRPRRRPRPKVEISRHDDGSVRPLGHEIVRIDAGFGQALRQGLDPEIDRAVLHDRPKRVPRLADAVAIDRIVGPPGDILGTGQDGMCRIVWPRMRSWSPSVISLPSQ